MSQRASPIELIGILLSGALERAPASIPPQVCEAISATVALYGRAGYRPPWIGYLGLEEAACVGICGFKSPPAGNRVEIAYCTLPPHEGRGVATGMATGLIDIARRTDAGLSIAAQTLPEENASTAVLKKLGFECFGTARDPEVGLVWEWRLPPVSSG